MLNTLKSRTVVRPCDPATLGIPLLLVSTILFHASLHLHRLFYFQDHLSLQCITTCHPILFLFQEPDKMLTSPFGEFVTPPSSPPFWLASETLSHVSLFCDGCFPGIHSPFHSLVALRLPFMDLPLLHCQDIGSD